MKHNNITPFELKSNKNLCYDLKLLIDNIEKDNNVEKALLIIEVLTNRFTHNDNERENFEAHLIYSAGNWILRFSNDSHIDEIKNSVQQLINFCNKEKIRIINKELLSFEYRSQLYY